ncbi:hypothetical protein DPMN_126381 [Dreissena polymorpha]|uniref:Uncharacterized protein n=1 Tax=Dreissena polymorpha TaxID=45954 RepID=A0A9D4GVZ7_DREPO|nr:hypothetical protein DPMN_126381 [Dreissena polymorpha]
MVMKVVASTLKKEDFLKQMEQQIVDFSAHVGRVRRQYEQSLNIKHKLPENEVIVHMDFSENYSCRSVNEIQSAY